MMTGWSSTKFLFFVADGKSKMASIFQISLPSDPMEIVLKDLYQNSICYSQFSWNLKKNIRIDGRKLPFDFVVPEFWDFIHRKFDIFSNVVR
jgi:hypothetical protein